MPLYLFFVEGRTQEWEQRWQDLGDDDDDDDDGHRQDNDHQMVMVNWMIYDDRYKDSYHNGDDFNLLDGVAVELYYGHALDCVEIFNHNKKKIFSLCNDTYK